MPGTPFTHAHKWQLANEWPSVSCLQYPYKNILPIRPQCGFVHICFINHPFRLDFVLNSSCSQTRKFVISASCYRGTIDKTLIINHHNGWCCDIIKCTITLKIVSFLNTLQDFYLRKIIFHDYIKEPSVQNGTVRSRIWSHGQKFSIQWLNHTITTSSPSLNLI